MQYPKWQEQIRKAQTICNQREAEKAEVKAAKERETNAQRGQLLAQALGYLGIELDEPPTENKVVLGRVRFHLDSYYNGDLKFNLKDNCVKFRLFMQCDQSQLPWKNAFSHYLETDKVYDYYITESIPEDAEIQDGWTDNRAWIANTIDKIEAAYEADLLRWMEHQERKAEPTMSARDLFLEALDNYLEERFGMRFE